DGGIVGVPEQMSLSPSGSPAEAQSLAGLWKYAVEETWPSQQIPTALYSGMVAPWIQFPIAGIIWYQGESNTGNSVRYRHLLRALVAGWRMAWKQPDLPFLVVQLPNYKKENPEPGESDWAALREGQALVAAETPNAEVAVTIDLGEADNIHPKNKQDVGLRLALLALAKVYHHKLAYSGPLCDGVKIEGSTLRLHFAHVGKGLVAQGGVLKGFAIAGADRRFVWANAVIDGDTVTVSSDKVTAPIALRYAWADNPVCNLTNSEGFPAAPFRTEGSTVIPGIKAGQ
ncbi:MAG: sialate O-acetylesterase, partial [Victivallales bacterium]